MTTRLSRERIAISIDPFTARNPSYCFVELATKDQADQAMEKLNGADLLGRPVEVKPGVPKSSRTGAEGWNDFRTNRSPGNQQPSAFQRWERDDASPHFRDSQELRLYVGGLPRMPDHGAVEAEMRKLFQGYNMYVLHTVFSILLFISD